MNYKKFTAEDFANNTSFKEWVMLSTEEVSDFWVNFLINNPEKKEDIQIAREFVLLTNSNCEEILSSSKEHQIKRNIDKAIDSFERKKLVIAPAIVQKFPRGNYSMYSKIAATFMIVALSVIAYIKLSHQPLISGISSSRTTTAPKGKRSFITLSDGTKVWLNADSNLKYAKDFNSLSSRDVYLEGEAFFDVAEDKRKPFVVHTSDISIRVLGTAFNVKSFAKDPNIETTLVRGKITINREQSPNEEITLLPSQQAVFKKETQELILQHQIKTEPFTAWKKGELIFNERPLTEVIGELERWYNVTIHIENSDASTCRFTGKFENENLEEVLELFKNSGALNFIIKGDQVYIKGNPCLD